MTNGSLLTPGNIAQLAEYPRLKIHLSLHTAEAENYSRITGQRRFTFERVRENLAELARSNIPVKINYVLLRGVNTAPLQIQKMIEPAAAQQVKAVKFLELLVMEKNEALYPYYYHIQSLQRALSRQGELVNVLPRRQTYRLKGGSLELELQKLCCKIGCANCLENRDLTFSAAGRYFPCMEASDKSFDVWGESLPAALQKGREVIAELIHRYGNRSPSLLQDARFQEGRRDLFFLANQATAETIRREGQLLERLHFVDNYYRPRTAGEEWRNSQRILKLRYHLNNDRNARLFGATVFLERLGEITCQRTVYWDHMNTIYEGEPEIARRFLERMDMECWLEKEVELRIYQLDGAEVSVSANGGEDWLVGVNLDSLENPEKAAAWLKARNWPLYSEKLPDLFVRKKEKVKS
ncbi:MAG: hypothetical protein Kow0037_18230 [Calditrichia bacterium]